MGITSSWLSNTDGSCFCCRQAKDALRHPYFDDLNKANIDELESDAIRARENLPPY